MGRNSFHGEEVAAPCVCVCVCVSLVCETDIVNHRTPRDDLPNVMQSLFSMGRLRLSAAMYAKAISMHVWQILLSELILMNRYSPLEWLDLSCS